MDIKPTIKRKRKKRVGRGGKRGTYSGRGLKGQGAHAGGRMPATRIEEIYKFPKLRGTKNRPAKPILAINVSDLERVASNGKISRESITGGRAKYKKYKVKILSMGEIKKAYTIKGIAVSKGAKEKIEKAGGSVEE